VIRAPARAALAAVTSLIILFASAIASAPAAHAACPDADTRLTTLTTRPQLLGAALCLTNEVRGARGLPVLASDARLDAAAQAHADDMTARDYFDHYTPEGRGPSERAFAQGYDAFVSENIAGTGATPRQVIAGWLRSPGHCQNLLTPFTETGLGLSFDDAAPWVEGFRPQRLRWVNMFAKTAGQSAAADACPVTLDDDADGVPDSSDFCGGLYDPQQKDEDQDWIGDACDPTPPLARVEPSTTSESPPASGPTPVCLAARTRESSAGRRVTTRRSALTTARKRMRSARTRAAKAAARKRVRAAERAHARAVVDRDRARRARRATC